MNIVEPRLIGIYISMEQVGHRMSTQTLFLFGECQQTSGFLVDTWWQSLSKAHENWWDSCMIGCINLTSLTLRRYHCKYIFYLEIYHCQLLNNGSWIQVSAKPVLVQKTLFASGNFVRPKACIFTFRKWGVGSKALAKLCPSLILTACIKLKRYTENIAV